LGDFTFAVPEPLVPGFAGGDFGRDLAEAGFWAFGVASGELAASPSGASSAGSTTTSGAFEAISGGAAAGFGPARVEGSASNPLARAGEARLAGALGSRGGFPAMVSKTRPRLDGAKIRTVVATDEAMEVRTTINTVRN
jgi:hypothetical protein